MVTTTKEPPHHQKLRELGHSHHWVLRKTDELYISRGECQCGAVRYFADDLNKETLARVVELNQLHAKEGSPEKVREQMKGKVKIKDLDKKTIAKLPVPPKPDLSGKGHGEVIALMHDYHESNKEQILAEVEKCGQTATRIRWDIPSPTWTGLRKRWNLPPIKRGGDNRRRKPRPRRSPALAPAAKRGGNGSEPLPLPAFPQWNENWNDRVKMAWLTAYAEMGRNN